MNESNLLQTVVEQLSHLPSAEGSLEQILDRKGEVALSLQHDRAKLQDSYTFRLKRRAYLISCHLIDEQGQFDLARLKSVIDCLEKERFLFTPDGYCDAVAMKHMQNVLQKILNDPSFLRSLQKFQSPLCHAWAEEIILLSNASFHFSTASFCQIQRAVLSALLTPLRQNVGSCFATAPAILIQEEQLESFLADLYELLMTGMMKKVIRGKEIQVPLSPSFGGGDLYKKVSFSLELCMSPGLISALEVAGVLSSEKNGEISQILGPIFQKTPSLTVKDLIHKALLLSMELNEEDVLRYQETYRRFVRSKEWERSGKGAAFSKKHLLVASMLEKEKKACAAFKIHTDHPLVKAWEFTLASFSESKMDFSRWNLYSSLGLHPEEKEGIGELIYGFLQKNLDTSQEKSKEYEVEAQVAYDAVRATELLLQNAGSESEVRRLQAELYSRVYHMRTCLELRDTAHSKASEYSTFFSFLLEQYDAKFPEYFQEIYDADLREGHIKEYEDSPAGFRLVYKHGRKNAFLWTMIYDEEEYRAALTDFFLLVEPQIAAESSWEHAAKTLSDITTFVIEHLNTKEFLETSKSRIIKAYGENVEGRTPWSYLSGGSMAILLQSYYQRESPATEETKQIEDPQELSIFLLDTLKSAPLSSAHHKKLFSSPTHAFILHPQLELFYSGWQADLFSYTWVRDKIIAPRKAFYEKITLSSSEQLFLLERLGISASQVSLMAECSVPAFRNQILEMRSFRFPADALDAFLYESLPLTEGFFGKMQVRAILSGLCDFSEVLESFPDVSDSYITAKGLKNLAKAVYLLSQKSLSLSVDLHEVIAKKTESIGLSPPAPLLFADTNWSQFFFGFIVNPGTYALELWRLMPSGFGFPMTPWNSYLNKTHSYSWSIYINPSEYTR